MYDSCITVSVTHITDTKEQVIQGQARIITDRRNLRSACGRVRDAWDSAIGRAVLDGIEQIPTDLEAGIENAANYINRLALSAQNYGKAESDNTQNQSSNALQFLR